MLPAKIQSLMPMMIIIYHYFHHQINIQTIYNICSKIVIKSTIHINERLQLGSKLAPDSNQIIWQATVLLFCTLHNSLHINSYKWQILMVQYKYFFIHMAKTLVISPWDTHKLHSSISFVFNILKLSLNYRTHTIYVPVQCT